MNGFPKISLPDFPVTCTTSYRFSFNGMENDNEIKGTGNSLDFGARMYDPRLGRFLSVDPLYKSNSFESPYIFAGNSPIYYIDKEGKSKTTYIILIEDGKTTVTKVIDYSQVIKEIVGSSYIHTYENPLDFHFDGESHPIYQEYDIIEYVTLDFTDPKKPKFTTTGELKGEPITFENKIKFWQEKLIGGGGIVFTSAQGELNINDKGQVKGAGDGRMINIDEFIGMLGGVQSSFAHSPPGQNEKLFDKLLGTLSNYMDASDISINLRSSFDKTFPPTQCESCGQINSHGKVYQDPKDTSGTNMPKPTSVPISKAHAE